MIHDKQHSTAEVFADLPAEYSNAGEEYRAARDSATFVLRNDLGILRLDGADHLDFLHRVTTNRVSDLQPGQWRTTLFANEKGRLIDRVLLFRTVDCTWALCSAQQTKTLTAWFDKYVIMEDVNLADLSRRYRVISLFGPESHAMLERLFQFDAAKLRDDRYLDISTERGSVLVRQHSDLHVPGVDILSPAELLSSIRATLNDASELGVRPMGHRAYESLRIESGFPCFGKDFDDGVNPHEAGMVSFVDFNKGCYIGQEVIARLDTYDKVQKHLMGLLIDAEKLPQPGDRVVAAQKTAGNITSAAFSFALQKNIALAYLKTRFARAGQSVIIETDSGATAATTTQLPFVAR